MFNINLSNFKAQVQAWFCFWQNQETKPYDPRNEDDLSIIKTALDSTKLRFWSRMYSQLCKHQGWPGRANNEATACLQGKTNSLGHLWKEHALEAVPASPSSPSDFGNLTSPSPSLQLDSSKDRSEEQAKKICIQVLLKPSVEEGEDDSSWPSDLWVHKKEHAMTAWITPNQPKEEAKFHSHPGVWQLGTKWLLWVFNQIYCLFGVHVKPAPEAYK